MSTHYKQNSFILISCRSLTEGLPTTVAVNSLSLFNVHVLCEIFHCYFCKVHFSLTDIKNFQMHLSVAGAK